MSVNTDALYEKLVNDSVPESARALKREVLGFINMIDQIMRENRDMFTSTELEDLVLINQFFSQLTPIAVINLFITQVLPHSRQIRARDKTYFATHAMDLFKDFAHDKVVFVYDILVNDKLDADDMEAIWDYWNVFVDLTEKYKKTK